MTHWKVPERPESPQGLARQVPELPGEDVSVLIDNPGGPGVEPMATSRRSAR